MRKFIKGGVIYLTYVKLSENLVDPSTRQQQYQHDQHKKGGVKTT